MMRTVSYAKVVGAVFVATSSALNILLNNDDSFGAANLRELKRALTSDGHDVVVVAPATLQSGQGGRSVFSDSATLQGPSAYNLVPAGSPAVGRDPVDQNIWYYNGTPAACTFIGLDYVIPQFYNNRSIDLVATGPNFGNNLGPFVWTLSGTAGAAYAAVGRGYPAIAFSAGNLEQRSYKWINQTTKTGYPDPAVIAGKLGAKVVSALVKNTKRGDRLLPLGYGLNVNWANIDSLTNGTCVDPQFYQTRYTGGALTDIAVRNPATGTFRYAEVMADGVNTCINGDCSLPGETEVVNSGCYGSVSVFTVDYSAPIGFQDLKIREKVRQVAKFGQPKGVKDRRMLSKREYEESSMRRHD